MVHGMFSLENTGFGALPKAFVAELHRRYQGRVFAFDHFTLSEDPRENVDWLLRQTRIEPPCKSLMSSAIHAADWSAGS